MIAEFIIENFYSIKSAQKISFEPSSDTFMSDEYSYEVKKEHCDVFVKYVVDEKEYKAKLEAGDCKYSVGDSVPNSV